MAKLPVTNNGEHAKRKCGRTSGQSIESVRQVDRVGRPDQDEGAKEEPSDRRQLPPREREPSERQQRRGVHPVKSEEGKDGGNDDLANKLPALVESQVAQIAYS